LVGRPGEPKRPLFLRQSVRSDYCGVYSTAMLLSRLGHPLSRAAALRLFDLPQKDRDYNGVNLDGIAIAVKHATKLRHIRWLFRRRFHFATVVALVRRHIGATRQPTLLWFGAVHRRSGAPARHIALVVRVNRDTLYLLDPLGRPPPSRRPFNVSIPNRLDRHELLPAEGSFYGVNPRMMVGILRWRPA